MRVAYSTTTVKVLVFKHRNSPVPSVTKHNGIPVQSFRTHRNYSRTYKTKYHYLFTSGYILAQLVQALGYKAKGRGSDSRWGN
jgi:hypothetical protein